MELFGGLMVLMWMIGFFLTVIWFVLPFVIFSIKARIEETLYKVELLDNRLASIERHLVNYKALPMSTHPDIAAPGNGI